MKDYLPRREHQVRAFLADHDAGGIGVARDHGRHDRGVGDEQGLDTVRAQLRVDHGVADPANWAGRRCWRRRRIRTGAASGSFGSQGCEGWPGGRASGSFGSITYFCPRMRIRRRARLRGSSARATSRRWSDLASARALLIQTAARGDCPVGLGSGAPTPLDRQSNTGHGGIPCWLEGGGRGARTGGPGKAAI